MITVGIVDPIVSPEELGLGLKKYGIKSVAIYQRANVSNKELQDRFKPEVFDEVVFVEENEPFDVSVQKLREHGLDYLFNGFDLTMPLTDKLAAAYPLATANDPATSQWRFHKVSGQMILEKKGIQHFESIEVRTNKLSPEDEERLWRWNFPVILKPANSGGTFGYSECASLADLKSKLSQNDLTSISSVNLAIDSYIIQEKLKGDEFAIDTFSLNGKHSLIHIRKYTKKSFNGIPLAKMAEAILPSDPAFSILSDFIFEVLDGVGFNSGFSHTEVFLTPRGPFAIDINPRLPGSKNASGVLAKATYGYSHVDIMGHVLLNKPLTEYRYQPGLIVYLHSRRTRLIREANVEAMKTLLSFKNFIPNKMPGTLGKEPAELSDSIGYVILSHENRAQIEADAEVIFKLDEEEVIY